MKVVSRAELAPSDVRPDGPFTIFVLGAGSSKDSGFPICSDFFSRSYLQAIGMDLQEAPEQELSEQSGIEQLLMRAYASDHEWFEQLRKFYERVFFRADSLFRNATGAVPPTKWAESFMHQFFLNALFLEVAASGRRVVILSFNHDLCVEELLRMRDFNYGSMTSRMHTVGKYPGLPSFGTNLVLLKLHGSFNFAHCRSCDSIWCERDWVWDKGDLWRCGQCQGRGHNFYVPPSVVKDVADLREAWEDAGYFLERAEDVFVVGYSLPKYDEHAVELFRRTNPAADLTVIDPYARALVDRYSGVPARRRYLREIGLRDFMHACLFESWEFEKF